MLILLDGSYDIRAVVFSNVGKVAFMKNGIAYREQVSPSLNNLASQLLTAGPDGGSISCSLTGQLLECGDHRLESGVIIPDDAANDAAAKVIIVDLKYTKSQNP